MHNALMCGRSGFSRGVSMARKRQKIQERKEQKLNAFVPSPPKQEESTMQQTRSSEPRNGGTRTTNGNGQQMAPSRMAKGLGFFSIGLGLAELLAPRGVAKLAG